MDIGIDLGTTFSVIAVNGNIQLSEGYPSGIYLEDCNITVIPSPYGEQSFPSVLLEDQDNTGRYHFGSDALQQEDTGQAPVLFSKRKMGTKEEIPLKNRTISAKEVACEFLRFMKQAAEQALGQKVDRAVITHPAYFDRIAVEETRWAAQEAGFDMSLPEQMLMEPVAAALAYVRTDKRDPLRILTYDLGGGTFDVTYLERRGGVIDMRAFDGDHLMGGYNFDRELAHWVREQLKKKGRVVVLDEEKVEDRARLTHLLQHAERVKIDLSKAPKEQTRVEFRARNILVDDKGKTIQINERLTRAEFTSLIRPYLDRALACCHRVLTKAGVAPGGVDEVLLVGGSTYGPWVKASLKDAFPHAKATLFYPDLCVGAGAAIHAELVLPPRVQKGTFSLTLDVPKTSALDTLNVAGQVFVKGAVGQSPGISSLSVHLLLPDGTTMPPEPVSNDGCFMFEDVELSETEPNLFELTLFDDKENAVLKHAFDVQYRLDESEMSTVTTVLPRPLYIMTFDGLVPLAKEGASLPVRCRQRFLRDNDNPNILIELFQEQEAIGSVRVENIPPESGRGSFVDLQVEITEKNQIRGHAEIRTSEETLLKRSEVTLSLDLPPLPTLEELRTQQDELRDRFETMEGDSSLKETSLNNAKEWLNTADRLFQQQPLERLEVRAALKQAEYLIIPDVDHMSPTRKAFCELIAECRLDLEEMRKEPQTAKNDNASPLDGTEANLQRANYYEGRINILEQEGFEAHEKRNHRTWGHVQGKLRKIGVQLRELPDLNTLPSTFFKTVAQFEVERILKRLNRGAGSVKTQGREKDWQEEINRIEGKLKGLLNDIDLVDGALPSSQGLAQIRAILHLLQPLESDIGKLGFDLRRAG